MQKLKKIDKQTNVLTWFEIPVTDLHRAKKFYEKILNIEMTIRQDGDAESAFFPFDPDVVQATSGRVTGVLSASKRNRPSSTGTMVYINASPSIDDVLNKIEPAGGKIAAPKIKIPAGFIAVILDSEGNRIGLHAEQ